MAHLQSRTGDKILLGHHCLVGRLPTCQLRIAHESVSTMHAMIRWDGVQWLVRDLGSTNGTVVDGRSLPANVDHPLRGGAQLAFGDGVEWELHLAGRIARMSREWRLTLPPAEAEPPTSKLELFVSRDGLEVDAQLCAGDGQRHDLALGVDAGLFVAQLEQASRCDQEEGVPLEERGWLRVDDVAVSLGVDPSQVEGWIREVSRALDTSAADDATSLLAQRDEGRQLRLAPGGVHRVGSTVAISMTPSSCMTALERTLYASPPEGLINLTYGYPEGQNASWIEAIAGAPFATGSTRGEHRAQIENHFRRLFGLDDILLTATASEALLVAIRTATRCGGDEVVLLEAGFDAYPGLVETCGAVPRFASRPDDGHLSPALVLDAIGPRTAAVLVTSPDNPTGVIHTREALAELARRCAARRIPLILDAVFHEVTPHGATPPSPRDWAPPSLDLMVVGDTGKILGLDGTKLGALLTSPGLHDRVVSVADNLFFQVPDYKLAVFSRIFTSPDYPRYLGGFLEVLARNHRTLAQGVGPFVRTLASEATSMALIDVSGTGLDGSAFAQRLLQEERVAAIPCSMFARGPAGPLDGLVRLALARPTADIEEAAARIAKFAARVRVPLPERAPPSGLSHQRDAHQ